MCNELFLFWNVQIQKTVTTVYQLVNIPFTLKLSERGPGIVFFYGLLLRRFALGGQVDSRMMSSGTMAIWSGTSFSPRMRCSNMRAAVVPMACRGWRMVVRLGL